MTSAVNTELAIRRAQGYQFLASAFLYPDENWTEDLAAFAAIAGNLGFPSAELGEWPFDLEGLQHEHRMAFGLVGSLCYETEYGLPHEFRQSQELADLAGFYNAFGFALGGRVHERPDHLSVELEFMSILALKEAYAAVKATPEQVEICLDAERKFLQEHLGHWIGLFAQSMAKNAPESPFTALARLAETFIGADAERFGVTLDRKSLAEVRPTPLGPEISCEDCSVAESAT